MQDEKTKKNSLEAPKRGHPVLMKDFYLDKFDHCQAIAKRTFEKSMRNFVDMENELDQKEIDDSEIISKRRKSQSYRRFEFQCVSARTVTEDLGLIYDGLRDEEEIGVGGFKKNDVVVCMLDRKKYRGSIVNLNQKGIVIRTADRRKIKVSWEDIDEKEAMVTKIEDH